MKRITFALCAACIALSTMAQGTLQKRLQGNPKIDSLVNEVTALGGNGKVSYYYDGKLHKTVSISCFGQEHQIYNAIRNTCKALTDDASESYTWEYHRNGVDSIRYTIALGEYQMGDTLRTWQRQRDVHYYGAPEIVTFRYDPMANNDGKPWTPKGLGYFKYEYTPDSIGRQTRDYVPFNKEAYMALLLPTLKQKGITSRQFYVYCDSTFSFKEVKWNDDDDFVMHEKTLTPQQPKSETRATVYTIQSKGLADSVLSQLIQTTWAFLEDNPGISFHFRPYTYYGLRTMNELFRNLDLKRLLGFYHIYLHCIDDKEFNIVILEGTGDMMVPMDWLIVKSWKNGKVVYDKKRMKRMTPKQARSNTSLSRSTMNRQYDPVD